jgi:hypothetical protein
MFTSILLLFGMIYSYEFSTEPLSSSVPKDRLYADRYIPSRLYNYGMDERPNVRENVMESITDPLFLLYGGNIIGTERLEKSYVPRSKIEAILALMMLLRKKDLLDKLESNSISEYAKMTYLEEYKFLDKPSITHDLYAGGLDLHGDW